MRTWFIYLINPLQAAIPLELPYISPLPSHHPLNHAHYHDYPNLQTPMVKADITSTSTWTSVKLQYSPSISQIETTSVKTCCLTNFISGVFISGTNILSISNKNSRHPILSWWISGPATQKTMLLFTIKTPVSVPSNKLFH